MRPHRFFTLAVSSVVVSLGLGCANQNYAASPPPPPAPLYNQTPPLVALADHNGFDAGRADGARDAYDRRPYRARSTRAYYETPGYDGNLGPFQPYQDSFRNAYLRGYDRGFRRGLIRMCACVARWQSSTLAAIMDMRIAPCEVSPLSELRPFHIAFPVDDLAAARHFYGMVLGCPEGRSSEQWIDFNLFGHQIVAHHKPAVASVEAAHANAVDGHDVPIPHFGVVLTQADWKQLAERVRAAGVRFIIEPYTRFEGQTGEQSTMFFLDPAGNALEFKAFADLSQMFAK